MMQGSISDRTCADAGNIHERIDSSKSFYARSHTALDVSLVLHVADGEIGARQLARQSWLHSFSFNPKINTGFSAAQIRRSLPRFPTNP